MSILERANTICEKILNKIVLEYGALTLTLLFICTIICFGVLIKGCV